MKSKPRWMKGVIEAAKVESASKLRPLSRKQLDRTVAQKQKASVKA